MKETRNSSILQSRGWKLMILCLGLQFYFCTGIYSPPNTGSGIHGSDKDRFIRYAKSYLGTPYRYGGADRKGIDCSGLVIRVYQDLYHMNLPHKSSLLYKNGVPVSLRNLEVGDLVFFGRNRGSPISHVGIYLGNDSFVHATRSKGVMVSELSERYYRTRYIGARRIKNKIR